MQATLRAFLHPPAAAEGPHVKQRASCAYFSEQPDQTPPHPSPLPGFAGERGQSRQRLTYSSSALQLFSSSALQLFSSSALQLFSSSALQLFSSSALQLSPPRSGGAPSAGQDGPLLYPGPLFGGELGTTGPQGHRQGCRCLFVRAGCPVEKPGPSSRTCRAGCPASAKRGGLLFWLLFSWPRKRKVTRAPKAHESSCLCDEHWLTAEAEHDPGEPEGRV